MFDINLPDPLTEEFISLIPSQRAHIDTLMVKGVVASYALSFDRSKLWVILAADSEEHALSIVRSFPLASFFRWEVHPLAFHSMTLSLAKVSLN